MKQTITVKVHETPYFGGDDIPADAAGFMAWFAAKLDLIPSECRDTATIELEGGDYRPEITIAYTRLETDAEESAREQHRALSAELTRNEELRTLARLQAKYGTAAP